MKSKIIVAAIFALACSSVFADEISNAPFQELVAKKIDELKNLRVGGYHQVWGRPNSTIDNIISEAAQRAAVNDLPTAISSAINAAKGPTRGIGQSCVITLIVTNGGAYTSTRECTTDYATRSQMDTIYYPSIPAYLVGRLLNIDFAKDNAGTGYAAFYTPAGRVSEFIVFTNATL